MDPNDLIVLIALIWLIGAGVIAWLAHREGRSAIFWFAGGVILSPLAALIGWIAIRQKRA